MSAWHAAKREPAMTTRRWGRLAAALVATAACLGPAVQAQDKAAAPAPVERIDTWKRIRDTGKLFVGVREASVPFSYLDARKEPQGYSVELCMKAADAIKAELKLPRLEVKFVPVSSANRIPALLEHRIDLECGSTTNTRERQQEVAFAYTTFVAGVKMLARTASNVNSVEDLRGKTVVVTKGTTSETIIKRMNEERLLKLTIIEAGDHNESFKAVEDGKAVAFPMDDVLLYGLISRSRKPDDYAVVGKFLSVEPYAIMMRKDEPQLEKVVNRALVELFQSGEIRRLYAKWFATKELTVPLNQYLKEAFSTPNTYPAWP